MRCEVLLTQSAEEFVEKNVTSERVLARIERACDLLADYPDMGTPYQASYPAAQPPFPCRTLALPDTPFTLYYLHDDEQVVVFSIEWSAGDPKKRFRLV